MQTKIILELGCNHNGSIDLSKKIIDDAVKLGVWGVKFQKRNPESMSQGEKLIPRDIKNSFGANYYEHRKALEFSVDQIESLVNYAKAQGLAVGVSVFDMVSADQMAQLDIDFIKLPSQFYSHYALNRLLMDLGSISKINIFVSTGMHTLNEVIKWQYFNQANVTFYCRSIYPCQMDELDFRTMQELKAYLEDGCLGYSSHDVNGKAIGKAVLLGAQYIERHYTLDKNMKGSDHGTVSSDFAEMQQIINDIEQAEELLYASNNLENLSSEKEKHVRMIYRGF